MNSTYTTWNRWYRPYTVILLLVALFQIHLDCTFYSLTYHIRFKTESYNILLFFFHQFIFIYYKYINLDVQMSITISLHQNRPLSSASIYVKWSDWISLSLLAERKFSFQRVKKADVAKTHLEIAELEFQHIRFSRINIDCTSVANIHSKDTPEQLLQKKCWFVNFPPPLQVLVQKYNVFLL